ncbi:unnamed protein product [Ambrosiozyma monospora]|uniref:Unnamed protein product n=1 Tax=Ambrosiozyma monospora TaxID=43982 RepID=A0A9W7DJJ2_AMBMO|nr:unnamed protein product [Ambrosiozyma monospora]
MSGRKTFYIYHAITAPKFPSNKNIRYAIQIALLEVINRKDPTIRAFNNRFAGDPVFSRLKRSMHWLDFLLHHDYTNYNAKIIVTTQHLQKQIICNLKKSYRQLGYYLESWFELTKRNPSNHNTKLKKKNSSEHPTSVASRDVTSTRRSPDHIHQLTEHSATL